MSPFRDAPEIELGPLDVGLDAAATRAMARVPRGGRVIARRAEGGPPHIVGAIGSAGVLSVVALALGAWSASFRPSSLLDLVLCAGAVLVGGLSLAMVWSALDHRGRARSRRGDVVGAEAREVLRRLTHLGAVMKRGRVSAALTESLRRALSAADEDAVAAWVQRVALGHVDDEHGEATARALAQRELHRGEEAGAEEAVAGELDLGVGDVEHVAGSEAHLAEDDLGRGAGVAADLDVLERVADAPFSGRRRRRLVGARHARPRGDHRREQGRELPEPHGRSLDHFMLALSRMRQRGPCRPPAR